MVPHRTLWPGGSRPATFRSSLKTFRMTEPWKLQHPTAKPRAARIRVRAVWACRGSRHTRQIPWRDRRSKILWNDVSQLDEYSSALTKADVQQILYGLTYHEHVVGYG